ncbi:hypothetical protein T08_13819 [Trichinella sp. T8]|nr:hypothetical protein T08_13819 [Trichinella sp. T8]
MLLGQPNAGSKEEEERTPSSVAKRRVNIYNRNKQQHEKSMVTQNVSEAQPPMSGSLKAGDLAIYVDDINHRRLPVKLLCLRPPLIWRWSFGVLVHLAASSTHNAHPSTSAHGVSLTTAGAARCRDNDLADGVRVLSSSYPRLLATSPWPGHTDYVGVVPFGTMLMMFLLATERCKMV